MKFPEIYTCHRCGKEGCWVTWVGMAKPICSDCLSILIGKALA